MLRHDDHMIQVPDDRAAPFSASIWEGHVEDDGTGQRGDCRTVILAPWTFVVRRRANRLERDPVKGD